MTRWPPVRSDAPLPKRDTLPATGTICRPCLNYIWGGPIIPLLPISLCWFRIWTVCFVLCAVCFSVSPVFPISPVFLMACSERAVNCRCLDFSHVRCIDQSQNGELFQSWVFRVRRGGAASDSHRPEKQTEICQSARYPGKRGMCTRVESRQKSRQNHG